MKKNKILHLKLLNKEELLSEVKIKNSKEIILINPMIVDEIKNLQTGQSSIVLSLYLLNDNQQATMNKDKIVLMTEVNLPIQEYYTNSLIYNKKYIINNKLNEISRVNEGLKQINSKKDIELSNNQNFLILKEPSNNSILISKEKTSLN